MILLLDNYDSFTYNLAQFLGQLGETLEVHRNDQITLDQIDAKKPQRIVISPGPGTPEDSGICVDVIRRFAGQIPILGVCLGHQAIGFAFGGKVIRAPEIMHGKTSRIHHDSKTIFKGVATGFCGHALPFADRRGKIVSRRSGNLRENRWHHHASLRHRKMLVEGVQFHPESVLTGCRNATITQFPLVALILQSISLPALCVFLSKGKSTQAGSLVLLCFSIAGQISLYSHQSQRAVTFVGKRRRRFDPIDQTQCISP